MIRDIRSQFNSTFTEETYRSFVESIHQDYPGALDFRVAESPIFIPKALKNKLIEASEMLIDRIVQPDFKALTQRAIPSAELVPNENAHSSFLAIDFAICLDENGEYHPQLIELQGFPSIFGYQYYLSALFQRQYPFIQGLDYLFNCASEEEYVKKLRNLIVADADPSEVILLEIFPEQQKTRIDFAVTERLLGVKAVCYTQLIREGRTLFYLHEGKKIQVKRIYNRLIVDDLQQQTLPDSLSFLLTDEVDVTWVGHPNWFYRISKFSLPFFDSPYVPTTRFLSDYAGAFPDDLENYVLKPLFSFAGSGVLLDPTSEDLVSIQDPENYILQRKVMYAPVVPAPDGMVKTEIRMMYGWPDKAERPELWIALSRLSRGKMIGVRFNKDFTWVGGSACFFEKE